MSHTFPLLVAALLALAPSQLLAQNSHDQSGPLGVERTGIMSEFNLIQVALRNAKTEREKEPLYLKVDTIISRTDSLRGKVVTANERVIDALNRLRGGANSRSATIKAVTEKLGATNQSLTALPLPGGPSYTPLEVNQVQRVLDACKTTLDQHRHACQNLPR